MNKIFLMLVIVAVSVGGYAYWKSGEQRPVGDAVLSATPRNSDAAEAVLKDGTYVLVAGASSMEWQGTKTLIVNYTDRGTVALASGSATVVGGQVTKGTVTVDMTTIKTTSTGKGSGESQQEKHLKSEDFFDVAKYPTSVFVFQDIKPASVSGQFVVSGTLSIKGITKPISFPATISAEGDTLAMKATVVLDRTLWGIKYASGKFFKELGDKVIGDEFTVAFTAVGKLVVQ